VFQTIQLIKFFLRTVYGNSQSYYGGGGAALPFQRVCQENGAGPAIWLAMSMVLVDMVCSHGNSVTFYSLISHQPTDLVGLLYVDNCNHVAIDNDDRTPCTAISKLQCNIYLWQGCLAFTSSSLLITKEVLLVPIGYETIGKVLVLPYHTLASSHLTCLQHQSPPPTHQASQST